MSLYHESSQFTRWRFTPAELLSLREASLARGLEAARRGGAPADATLSLADEAALLRHHQGQLVALCAAVRRPRKALETALVFMRRLYARASALELDPQLAAPACLYLACKVEDAYASAETLAAACGMPAEALLRAEVRVLAGLGFDLLVHAPHRALDGLLADVAAADAAGGGGLDAALRGLPPERVARLRAAALAAVEALLHTDAALTHSPGQIALAALRSAAAKVLGARLDEYVDRAAAQAAASGEGASGAEGGAARLRRALAELDALGVAGSAVPDPAAVAPVDRSLKLLRAAIVSKDGGGGGGGGGEGGPKQDSGGGDKRSAKRKK